MPRYKCKNKECISYTIEKLETEVKFSYNEELKEMIDSHIICPDCGEIREPSDPKKDYKDLTIYYPKGLDIQLKKW